MSGHKTDRKFRTNLLQGAVVEILFERLAVHSGWFVRHTGDQYRGIISPAERFHLRGADNHKTPDFQLSRTEDFKKSITVEIKSQKTPLEINTESGEDILVLIDPTGYRIIPPEGKETLRIPEEDWAEAIDFFASYLTPSPKPAGSPEETRKSSRHASA